MHLLILTPIFRPSSGGAATYYDLLVSSLLSANIVTRVTVVTERVPGHLSREICDARSIEVIRIFPHRAGGRFNKLSQYARYGIQNLLYFLVPDLVHKCRPDVVLIHSSFHNFFNLLTPVVCQVAKSFPVIADVRDHQLPRRSLDQLEPYQALIACSLNVLKHVGQRESLLSRTVHIPVIQESLESPRRNARDTLEKYNLTRDSYLLFAGLIKQGKGIDLLLSAYEALRSRCVTDQLVLVGLIKDTCLLERALKIPGVRSLGSVSRGELLDMMSCSRMVINLSGSEGMPRTSLEGLALGVRSLLPRGIPEFELYCPDSVACSSEPELVANQIITLLAKEPQTKYPINQHESEAVLPQYGALFEEVCREFQSRTLQ